MTKYTLLLGSMLAASSLSAQTLLDEQFNPGDFTAYNPGVNDDLNPNTGGVYRMSLGDSGFIVTPGGELLLNASADFGANIDFAAYTLSQGETVSVSFDATYNGTSTNNFTARFGLFETGGISSNGAISSFPVDGVAAQFGATTGSGSRYGVMDDNTGFNSVPDSFIGSWAASATSTTTTFGYTMTRTALDELDLAFTINGSTIAGSEQTIAAVDVPTFTIDTFAIFLVNPSAPDNNNEILIDNVFVSVPEPSAYGLLAGILAMSWVMLRRRG